MKTIFRVISVLPWPVALLLPPAISRSAGYQGFEGAWLIIFSLAAFHLSALVLLIGCFQSIYEVHQRQRPWWTLLFTTIGGSYFLLAYLLQPPDAGNWSGGNLMKLYSMVPATIASLLQLGLLLFLMRRWRAHLGLVLFAVHAAIGLFFSSSYLIGFISKIVSHDYRPYTTGVPQSIVRLHQSFSFIGTLCVICGALSLFLLIRDARLRQPEA